MLIYHLAVIFLLISFSRCNPTFVIDIYQDKTPVSNDNLIEIPKDGQIGNDSVVLYKFLDAEYYGLISIGKPAKQFKVIFDTAWADSWIPSQHCAFSELACMAHTRYDSSKSSTYKENGQPWKVSDEELELSGFLSTDDFHLAHLKVENQTFVEITHMSLKPFLTQKADGIIGLGWKTLATSGTVPFFYNMMRQKLVNQNVFTFYMNRDETTDKAGRLILGGTERSHIRGNLTQVNVVEKKYWTIKMDRLTIDVSKMNKTYAFCQNTCNATMDTSANTITGPASEIDAINNLLGARKTLPVWPYKYMVSCRDYAKLPEITFVFNDEEFTIQSKYYVQHLVYLGFQVCLSPFVPSQLNVWELGGAFLMEFYTEFDFDTGRIGIAKTTF